MMPAVLRKTILLWYLSESSQISNGKSPPPAPPVASVPGDLGGDEGEAVNEEVEPE